MAWSSPVAGCGKQCAGSIAISRERGQYWQLIGNRGLGEEDAFQVSKQSSGSLAEGKTRREGEFSFLHMEFELPVKRWLTPSRNVDLNSDKSLDLKCT